MPEKIIFDQKITFAIGSPAANNPTPTRFTPAPMNPPSIHRASLSARLFVCLGAVLLLLPSCDPPATDQAAAQTATEPAAPAATPPADTPPVEKSASPALPPGRLSDRVAAAPAQFDITYTEPAGIARTR